MTLPPSIDAAPVLPPIAKPRANMAWRVVAILAALLVLAIGALISFGTVLVAAAAVGIAYRVRRGRGLSLGNFASWGAATATMLVMLMIGAAVLASRVPRDTWRDITTAADSASKVRKEQPVPEWIQRLSPAAAEQARRQQAPSPAMQRGFMIAGIAMTSGMLAGFYGSLAWLGAQLLGLGFGGRWPGRAEASRRE